MKRRSALKNMGMVFGYAVATPTLISLAQSCKEKMPYAEWVPNFFEKDEGYALAQLIDVILPKTDTPSATEVNVHVFIDEFAKSVLPEVQQGLMRMTMNIFFDKVLEAAEKESLLDIEGVDFEPQLAKYLKVQSKEAEKNQREAVETYMAAISKGAEATLDKEIASFIFANNIRGLATWGYKTSEYIGEEVLAYLPLPGEYIACGDLDQLTGGKAWSL